MTPRLTFLSTPLDGLLVVQRQPICDERGLFERVFCAEELATAGITMPIVQANRTKTKRAGTIRGMHFQHPPHTETKIISCLAGRIFDVAVDLRRGSPTFLRWHGEELSADNSKSLLIPKGFAHGFQTLIDDCELLYFHDTAYAAESEGGISPKDTALAIAWPLNIREMSERDASHQRLPVEFVGL